MKFTIKPRRIFVNLLTKIKFINRKPFIDASIWSRDLQGGVVRSAKEIASAAARLVADAQMSGYNLKIEDVRCEDSYGMGHTDVKITVSNSYERMRAVMDSPQAEVLPEHPPNNVYNILVHPTDTHVTVDYRNGTAQYFRPVGPSREITIYTKGWPVMCDDEDGYNQLWLVFEDVGNYKIKFDDKLNAFNFYNGILPVFSEASKDMLIMKSRGLRNVYLEPLMCGFE